MASLLLAVLYLAFIGLGLPDSLLGAAQSQAIIGVQMASAYIGICVMPPLFGWIAGNTTLALYPVYLLAVLALMFFLFHSLPKEKA